MTTKLQPIPEFVHLSLVFGPFFAKKCSHFGNCYKQMLEQWLLRQVHGVNAKQVCAGTEPRMGSRLVLAIFLLLVFMWPVLINSELKFNMGTFITDINKLFVIWRFLGNNLYCRKEVCRNADPLLALGFGSQRCVQCTANVDCVDLRQLFSTCMEQFMLQKGCNPTWWISIKINPWGEDVQVFVESAGIWTVQVLESSVYFGQGSVGVLCTASEHWKAARP